MQGGNRGNRRMSVCLSVKHVNCDKTEEKSIPIFIPYERSFSVVFREKEWLVGGGETTTSTWNFGSNRPRWTELADFQSIFARSASAITPSEKSSINTNRKSTTRFPMNPRWSSYVVPKPRRFPSKIALRLKFASCYSFFVWKLSATKL